MADLRMERVLWRHQYQVIGVDEAGRGPLAGPVVAGACILPEGVELPGVNDSKRLSEKRRLTAFEQIKAVALGWGVGVVNADRIDRINILQATFEAMELAVQAAITMAIERAVAGGAEPISQAGEAAGGQIEGGQDAVGQDGRSILLIDGNQRLPRWSGEQRTVVGGDRKSLSIAAASILAKVTRDQMMIAYDERYPGYGFASNKGYASKQHLAALDAEGPSPIHRITFIDHRQLRFF